MQNEPMTEYGHNKLLKELKHLREVERPQVVKDIDTAREHGDLKENAEYHAAKEKQVLIESRISELSDLLSRARVIDPSTLAHDKVSFGSSVKLEDLDSGSELTYTIVGGLESNPSSGLISINSPLAKQLLGKRVGDEVSVALPKGNAEYEILEVFYKEIQFD